MVCLHEDVKKMRTEASDCDASIHSLELLQAEVVAVRDQGGSLFCAGCSRKQSRFFRANFRHEVIVGDLSKELKSGLKRRLIGLEMKLLSLKIEYALLHWICGELNEKVAKLWK